MRCPRCNSDMERISFKGVTVDRCLGCRGLWFDRMEREMLLATDGSEVIDVGPVETGDDLKGMPPADCPVCRTLMIRMVDGEDFDVWYQACPNCRGTFLKAGEFAEHKIEVAV
jgi:uncharacterized protein